MSKFSHSQHKSIFDAAFDIPYLALFRYPQIIPLQIQALTPCTSESWEEIVFILTPNHSNERGFSSKARLLHPPRFKSSSSHSRFLLLTHIFDSFHEKKKKKEDWNRLSHVPTAAGAAAGPALHPPRTRERNKSLETPAHD